MGGQSLFVTFVVLVATGTVPLALRLLTRKSWLAARCRADAGNPGPPVRTPPAEHYRTLERSRERTLERSRERTLERIRNTSGASRPREAGRLGDAAQIERNQQGRRRNTSADRGRGRGHAL